MYGQLFTVEYTNNKEDEFLGVRINLTYSLDVSEKKIDNNQTIL